MLVFEFTQNHHELIATNARHDVVVAHGAAEPACHLAQETITHGVAQRVVDALEVVHVNEHHRQAAAVATRIGHQLVQARLQCIAIGQPGQGIAVRQALDGRCRPVLFGDVGVDGDKPSVCHRQPAHLQDGAVGPGAGELVGQALARARQQLLHLGFGILVGAVFPARRVIAKETLQRGAVLE